MKPRGIARRHCASLVWSVGRGVAATAAPPDPALLLDAHLAFGAAFVAPANFLIWAITESCCAMAIGIASL